MFVDTAIISIRSGKGGDGCMHLLRLKGNAKGGPDGGDGGKGGDIIVVGDAHVDTLMEFGFRPHWFAKDGEGGTKKNCAGKAGADCILPVPLGAQIFDADTDALLADVTEAGQTVIIARGGFGGFGNDRFKSPVHQTPTEFTPGGAAIELRLRLELRLIADVGLVGLPNAGKSTFLRATTRANPKVADYPFTTLAPQLGIAELSDDRRLVLADLPGLIEGASQGVGLGHEFLRHIERTRVILHVLDVAPTDGSDPAENHRVIRRELAEFSEHLARTPEIVVLNKIDLIPQADRDDFLRELVERLVQTRGVHPLLASGASGVGVRAVLEATWDLARRMRDQAGATGATPRQTCDG
ncbi:MAG: Obg family GTPase CgtA [Phycisphaerales bacterium]|nr:Obg family GTPase CgtA [Phycisphaerales bacterium]